MGSGIATPISYHMFLPDFNKRKATPQTNVVLEHECAVPYENGGHDPPARVSERPSTGAPTRSFALYLTPPPLPYLNGQLR